MKLPEELAAYGCQATPEQFEERLLDILANMLRDVPNPEERLLYWPDHAKRFCEAVRCSLNCPGLPDEMILRRLQNIRKKAQR